MSRPSAVAPPAVSPALSRFLSWPSDSSRLVVTIIGAGNLAHVFCGLLGARTSELSVNILSRKADQIAESMTTKGVRVNFPDGSAVVGKVAKVSSDPRDVIPQADFVILTVPSHGRPAVMKSIAPHLSRTRPVFVGVMPGMGGFNFIGRQICESHGLNNIILWGVKDVPFMCAHTEPGISVKMLGPKTSMFFALDQWNEEYAKVGGHLITELTKIPTVLLDSFLVITLTPGNPIMHPSLMYGAYGPYSQWNGKPVNEKPLFYEEVSELSSYFLTKCDEEVQSIKKAIESASGINLEAVWPLRLNLKKVYGPIVEDNRTLMLAMRTNQAYKTIRTPLKAANDGSGGFTIDVNHRFFLEDIPFGLVVLSDLGSLVNVKTPMINEILLWAQGLMGKEYINPLNGKLTGKNMKETGAPSIWGIKSLKQLTLGAKISKGKSSSTVKSSQKSEINSKL